MPHRPAPPQGRVPALPGLTLIPRDRRAAQTEKKVAAAARQAHQVCAPHDYTRPHKRGPAARSLEDVNVLIELIYLLSELL